MPQLSKRAELEILEQERSKNASTIVSTAAYLVFAPCAAAVAALPGFLFTTGMFGVEFEANIALYVAVTAVTSFLLLSTYGNAATGRYFKLWSGDTGRKARAKAAGIQSKAGKKGAKDTRYRDIESATQTESKAYALGMNNVLFVLLSLTMAFVVCKPMMMDYPQVNYVISTISPAVFLAWWSTFDQ
jgi:hypothetical protein